MFYANYDLESISKLKKGKQFYSYLISFPNDTHAYFKDRNANFFILKGHLLIFYHNVLYAEESY